MLMQSLHDKNELPVNGFVANLILLDWVKCNFFETGVKLWISNIFITIQYNTIQYNIRLIKVDRTQLQTRHSKNHTYSQYEYLYNV